MLSSDVLVPASGLAAANARLILNHTRSHPSLTPFFDRHRDTSSLRSVCSLQDLDELSLDPLLEFWSLVALSLEDGPDYVCFTRPLITQNGAQMLNAELTTYASINALRELLLGVQPPLAFAEAWPDLSSACRSFWSHAIQNGSEAREILLEGSAKIAFSNSPLLEPVRPMAPAFNLSPEELSAAAQTILSSEALSKAFAASRFTGLVDADLFPAQLSDARASQSLCAILSAYGAAHATAAAVIWAIAAGSATQASPQKEVR